MDIMPLLDDFLRHARWERNLSPHTVSQYTRDLHHWRTYLERRQVPLDTDAITVPVMRAWLQAAAQSGKQPPTITRNLCCLRSFWKFARRYHGVEHDPMAALVAPIPTKRLPEVPTRSEVMRLFQACDQSHYRFHRVGDKAVIAILACLGLRRQELIDLRLADFDPEARTLLVRSAKRGRQRVVPLTDDLIALITDWLAIRPACDQPHLFLSRHGTPLSPHGLEHMLGRLAKQAGLEKRPQRAVIACPDSSSTVRSVGLSSHAATRFSRRC
jgi:site-specific recombinase XerD